MSWIGHDYRRALVSLRDVDSRWNRGIVAEGIGTCGSTYERGGRRRPTYRKCSSFGSHISACGARTSSFGHIPPGKAQAGLSAPRVRRPLKSVQGVGEGGTSGDPLAQVSTPNWHEDFAISRVSVSVREVRTAPKGQKIHTFEVLQRTLLSQPKNDAERTPQIDGSRSLEHALKAGSLM